MSEITRLAASVLADLIRQGRLSAIEVVDAHLERMARIDPEIAAYVTILADRARSDARQRDAEARAGRRRGALHGVPVAI
ncbi:MAG: amidase family protein, partial [Armatimonadota bacterium]